MTTSDYAMQPYDDTAETEVLPRRRPRLTRLTLFLGLAAVAGGAFVGGVEIQKHYGGSGTSSGTGGSSSQQTGARSGNFRAGGNGPASRFGGRVDCIRHRRDYAGDLDSRIRSRLMEGQGLKKVLGLESS